MSDIRLGEEGNVFHLTLEAQVFSRDARNPGANDVQEPPNKRIGRFHSNYTEAKKKIDIPGEGGWQVTREEEAGDNMDDVNGGRVIETRFRSLHHQPQEEGPANVNHDTREGDECLNLHSEPLSYPMRALMRKQRMRREANDPLISSSEKM